MMKEFLKPIENTIQYEVTKMYLENVFSMKEIGEIVGISPIAAQRRINVAALKLGFESESAIRLKQEYIWFLERKTV